MFFARRSIQSKLCLFKLNKKNHKRSVRKGVLSLVFQYYGKANNQIIGKENEITSGFVIQKIDTKIASRNTIKHLSSEKSNIAGTQEEGHYEFVLFIGTNKKKFSN